MSHTEPSENAAPPNDTAPPNNAPARHRATGAAHRLSTRAADRARHIGRRSQTIALTTLAIAALGLGGAAAALKYPETPEQVEPATAAAVADRTEAANRADRSDRRPTANADPSAQAGFGAADATPAQSGTSRAAEPTDGEPTAQADADPAAATDTATTAAAEADTATAAQVEPTPTATPDWVSPMPNAQTTSCYGQRWGVLHAGVDLALPAGTPVLAAGAGTVSVAGWAYTGYGISVVIDHGDGILTHYAHLSATAVAVGDQVSPGDVIGAEGSTGDSTGPHLHFEVHLGGLWSQIDPAPWMRERGVELGC
ncbi:M23 family metallopeptidase [Micromonospora sp. NBC_01813]|uniref:M23 family metallopeptidase n=1 Tax=Micromonospora sp. NBC_01813 TaxID=2975988 RepID=UPI002DD86ABC|nr:M23 family metallopeptidase [Micromonospora sp. NBC_01813]WSA08311.1 M23 family metallopeptidase [Micromonospora sp. NBC_01813]